MQPPECSYTPPPCPTSHIYQSTHQKPVYHYFPPTRARLLSTTSHVYHPDGVVLYPPSRLCADIRMLMSTTNIAPGGCHGDIKTPPPRPSLDTDGQLYDGELSKWNKPSVGNYSNINCRMGWGKVPTPKDQHTPCPACCSPGDWNQQTGTDGTHPQVRLQPSAMCTCAVCVRARGSMFVSACMVCCAECATHACVRACLVLSYS